MANIVRNPSQGSSATLPSLFHEWDPFRVMDHLLRWEPQERGQRRTEAMSFAPSFDVKETADGFLFRADLPGVKEADVEVSVNGNRLTISGKRDFEERKENDNYFMLERSFGSFSRSFSLPDSADTEKTKADLNNGVLTILMPKRAEAQPRKVTLNSTPTPQGRA